MTRWTPLYLSRSVADPFLFDAPPPLDPDGGRCVSWPSATKTMKAAVTSHPSSFAIVGPLLHLKEKKSVENIEMGAKKILELDGVDFTKTDSRDVGLF